MDGVLGDDEVVLRHPARRERVRRSLGEGGRTMMAASGQLLELPAVGIFACSHLSTSLRPPTMPAPDPRRGR
ncbi:hypothetical protein, partial [Actinacidiphila oryziradicis]|uniref:hypothetical protein n=1 Tax=Actinacidiphila oryziradicis TaxID=2571141 RepID=UPI001B800404